MREGNIIPVIRQAELLGVARSTVYYEPVVDIYTLELMRLIDEEYTKDPFYGSRKITAVLRRRGYEVNRKRIQRLMRLMLCGAYHNMRNNSFLRNKEFDTFFIYDTIIDKKFINYVRKGYK